MSCLFLGGLKEVCSLQACLLACYWLKPDVLHHFLLELPWSSRGHSFLERSSVWWVESHLFPFKAKTKGSIHILTRAWSVCS